jgi:UDP-N-acetylmuramoylalanine--D-glutamate ligase
MKPLMEIKDRNVLVMGMARSGCAAATLLAGHGARVTVTDVKKAEELGAAVEELSLLGVKIETNGHHPDTLKAAELIVISPGVSLEQPVLAEAKARGVMIISELELGYWFCRGRIIAVTGTNGKTTTVHLLASMLQEAGLACVLAGNMGRPFTSIAETVTEKGLVILEVSSFQLETVKDFRPQVAAILNITPDHLDRYSGMQAYVEAKAGIMRKQTAKDILVLNAEDKFTPLLSTQAPSRVLTFSREHPAEIEGVWVEKGKIKYRFFGLGQGDLMPADELLIPGPHNLENALAVVAIGLTLGIPGKCMTRTLHQFKGVPHRLESVAILDGVRFINDSKGTNVDAVIKALQSYNAPIILILGGRDKQGEFTGLRELLSARARAVVVMGEAAETISRQIKDVVPIIREKELPAAVRSAAKIAREGEIVLFSPGCASFDQFSNFEERGAAFCAEVKKLSGEASKKVV